MVCYAYASYALLNIYIYLKLIKVVKKIEDYIVVTKMVMNLLTFYVTNTEREKEKESPVLPQEERRKEVGKSGKIGHHISLSFLL